MNQSLDILPYLGHSSFLCRSEKRSIGDGNTHLLTQETKYCDMPLRKDANRSFDKETANGAIGVIDWHTNN